MLWMILGFVLIALNAYWFVQNGYALLQGKEGIPLELKEKYPDSKYLRSLWSIVNVFGVVTSILFIWLGFRLIS